MKELCKRYTRSETYGQSLDGNPCADCGHIEAEHSLGESLSAAVKAGDVRLGGFYMSATDAEVLAACEALNEQGERLLSWLRSRCKG